VLLAPQAHLVAPADLDLLVRELVLADPAHDLVSAVRVLAQAPVPVPDLAEALVGLPVADAPVRAVAAAARAA
jgi:hypothetical protein